MGVFVNNAGLEESRSGIFLQEMINVNLPKAKVVLPD